MPVFTSQSLCPLKHDINCDYGLHGSLHIQNPADGASRLDDSELASLEAS